MKTNNPNFRNKSLDTHEAKFLEDLDECLINGITYIVDGRDYVSLRVFSREESAFDKKFGLDVRIGFTVEVATEPFIAKEHSTTMLWYTFNSLLSIAENQRNLRDYVTACYRTISSPPDILPNRS